MNAAVLETADDLQLISPVDAVVTHDGPVLIDFDAMIYLRDSTEDFIDSARPALLASLLLRLLEAIKPWRWTGGDATRDVWRVRCVLLLFPWTKQRWLQRAPMLAVASGNAPLIAAMQKRSMTPSNPPIVITTHGFEMVVAPLVAALGLSSLRLIAARHATVEDQLEGKFRMIVRRIGHEAVRRALVLTSSRRDDMLLDSCAVPLQLEWSQARRRVAFSDRYFPGQYLAHTAEAGETFGAAEILREEFALWVLASIALSAQPILHGVGLLFLLLSFWTVYEIGCIDRDRIAARKAAVSAPAVAPRLWVPWTWASISGALAAVSLRGFTLDAAIGCVEWCVVLVTIFGAFALYSRSVGSVRNVWRTGLQVARAAAFVALVPIHLIGAVAIGAHVIAKWVTQHVGETTGKPASTDAHAILRLSFFALLAMLTAFATGPTTILNWSAFALLAWNLWRARRKLSVALQAIRQSVAAREAPQRRKPQPVDKK